MHGVPRCEEIAAATPIWLSRTALRTDVLETTALHLVAGWLALVVLAQLALLLFPNPSARPMARATTLSGTALPPRTNARSLRRERRIHTLYPPKLT